MGHVRPREADRPVPLRLPGRERARERAHQAAHHQEPGAQGAGRGQGRSRPAGPLGGAARPALDDPLAPRPRWPADPDHPTHRAPLAFERLWRETGCRAVVEDLAAARGFGFSPERACFLTVLHRLMVSGSDRAADAWRDDYRIEGTEGLALHHLYRTMAWLGAELPAGEQAGRTPFAPRCTKDLVEERLFEARRDLFSELSVVFLDTPSLYFEGAGGETLGQRGHSKD